MPPSWKGAASTALRVVFVLCPFSLEDGFINVAQIVIAPAKKGRSYFDFIGTYGGAVNYK